MKTLRTLGLALFAAGWLTCASAQGLRPEIGKPLQQASELLRAGKAKEALAKVREAEAVSGRTPAEQLTIDRMKAAAAQRAGDHATAIQALEAVYSSGKLSGNEAGQYAEQIASAYAQTRNLAKSNEWANKAAQGGYSSASLKQLQAYLLSQSGDYGAILKEAAATVAAAEQAGKRPDEGDLLRMADAQQRTEQTAGYLTTLEKLLSYYPKKDYWTAYLARLPRKGGFGDRFALDVMRLKLASGTLTKTDDFMEMAQLALQAGLPAEGLNIVDRGIKAGMLGSGPEAARHQRLRDLAVKMDTELKASIASQASEAANQKDGDALLQVGYAYVTMGEADRGIKLIEQAIAKGGLKHPADAKLRLGMAQLQSPANKARGTQTLRGVQSKDGAADIAKLWIVLGG